MADNNFAEALSRAKQLAAKFGSDTNAGSSNNAAGSSTNGAVKRPAEDYSDNATSHKRGTLEEKIAIAAEKAQALNQNMGAGNVSNGANTMTIPHRIPDNFVGLIIGKKGEQIMRIQQETGCNVQIAPDSGGLPDRQVTLSGTIEQIEAVKAQFSDIIAKAKSATPVTNNNSNYVPQNLHSIDISVPGTKAGLIIGKNGDTIKQLQEQCGVKMVIIQDSNAPTNHDKPLRISGEESKVMRAKEMVIDLLNSKNNSNYPNDRTTVAGIMSQQPGTVATTFAVPADKTGLVIGKAGETIKEIIRNSGAHVEIQKTPPPNPTIKIFNINGSQQQIDAAIRIICEKANIPSPQQSGGYGGSSASYSGQYGASAGSGMDMYGASSAASTGNQWSMGANGTAAASSAAQPGAESMPAPTVNPQTGQPDYTMAWVHYYRKQGMHEQAEAILRQSQQQQPSTTAAATSQSGGQQPSAGDYNQQWQQYHSQQQQQAAYGQYGMWQQGGGGSASTGRQ